MEVEIAWLQNKNANSLVCWPLKRYIYRAEI